MPLPSGQLDGEPLPVCKAAQTISQLFVSDGINKILHHQLLRKVILNIDRPLLVCKLLAHALQRVAVIPEPALRVCNDTILVFKDRSPIFFGHKPVLLSVVCLRGRAEKRGRPAPCDNRKRGTNISTGFSRTGVSPYWWVYISIAEFRTSVQIFSTCCV